MLRAAVLCHAQWLVVDLSPSVSGLSAGLSQGGLVGWLGT